MRTRLPHAAAAACAGRRLLLQVFSHAFAGGIFGALRHWYDTGFVTPIDEVFDAPLALLDEGIDLD